MAFKISELYIYPVKSLRGIALDVAKLSSKGLEYDRHWMLIDKNGKAFTQRDNPQLALFEVELIFGYLVVTYGLFTIKIPLLNEYLNKTTFTTMWGETIAAYKEGDIVSNWFSKRLGQEVYLVRPVKTAPRRVKNHPESKVGFSDGNQYLVIGQSSLDHLNAQLEEPITMDRFRPNIVFKGGDAHSEDRWKTIKINGAKFESTKPCARCVMITINQQTGEKGKEPLKTLTKYRYRDNKVWFGQYLKFKQDETEKIAVGDEIEAAEETVVGSQAPRVDSIRIGG